MSNAGLFSLKLDLSHTLFNTLGHMFELRTIETILNSIEIRMTIFRNSTIFEIISLW